jgi:hypothetical protein
MNTLAEVAPNIPFLAYDTNVVNVEHGCEIFAGIKQCLGGVWQDPQSLGCIDPDLRSQWETLETYTCQLLAPVVKVCARVCVHRTRTSVHRNCHNVSPPHRRHVVHRH